VAASALSACSSNTRPPRTRRNKLKRTPSFTPLPVVGICHGRQTQADMHRNEKWQFAPCWRVSHLRSQPAQPRRMRCCSCFVVSCSL
jgi:hypothetical protein